MEEAGRHHRVQVIKVNTARRGQVDSNSYLMGQREKLSITSVIVSPKIHNLSVLKKKHQRNPSQGASLKSPAYNLKNVEDTKD